MDDSNMTVLYFVPSLISSHRRSHNYAQALATSRHFIPLDWETSTSLLVV
jgi:hypothetical protein